MSLTVLGIDPGLAETGLAVVTFGRELEAKTGKIWKTPDHATMAREIADVCHDASIAGDALARRIGIRDLFPAVDAIAIEDFRWRPAKVDGHRKIINGLEMARMLGRLDVLLEDVTLPITWTVAKDTLRDQPFGKEATAFGIPGRNDHERSAFYQARWLLGTLRLAGGR